MKYTAPLMAVALTSALVATPAFATSETKTITISKAAVAAAFNTALQGTQIRLDNYGGKNPKKKKSTNKHEVSWLFQESYVRLPGGQTYKFDIPEQSTKVGKLSRYLRHYVSDMNSQSIQVGAHGAALDLTLHFESQGREIKGKCIKKIGKNWSPCKNKLDRDMQLDNAWVKVHLVPVAYKGGVSFKPVGAQSVDFKADLKVLTKLCSIANNLCKNIGNAIYNKIRSTVRQQIAQRLSSNSLRTAVATQVKSKLSQIAPNWEVTKVASQGKNFLVTVTYPVPIDGKTVSIKSFKVKKAKQSMRCPGKVEFSATVHAKHRHGISGKVWLEYLTPSKGASKKQNWSMGGKGAGSATSTLTQTWQGKGNKYLPGKTRLVVQWKGSNGKSYTQKSKPVNFERRCLSGVTDRFSINNGAGTPPSRPVQIAPFAIKNPEEAAPQ